jgi:hypothetical protein
MRELQNGNKGLLTAFEHESFGATWFKGIQIPEYLGAFHPDYSSDIKLLEGIIEIAAKMFTTNCGYRATHFIAPNREGAKELDKKLSELGVEYLTMSKLRRYPLGNEKYKREYNWLGKRNKTGQIIITRNCFFESSDPLYRDWVNPCLKEIENAFKWQKPAVIGTHRVNYIGFINKENAIYGLKELDRLLSTILKKWPDAEFMTSTELGEIIKKTKS